MLAKITRGNQLTIPKEIVEKAHLVKESPYVDVEYNKGVIYLKPVLVEERIEPEQFDKFYAWALKEEPGDYKTNSLEDGIQHLKKRAKKK